MTGIRAVAGVSANPELFNFNTDSLRSWNARLNAARAPGSTTLAKVLCVGDSTSRGYRSSTPYFDYQSYPAQLKTQMAALGIPASYNAIIGDGNTQAALPTFDPRVVLGTNWAASNYATSTLRALGGTLIQNAVSTGSDLSFTVPEAFNTIDVYAARSAGLGTFTVRVGAGAVLSTVNTAGADALLKTTVPVGSLATAGSTINIQATVAGGAYIAAIHAYRNDIGQVAILNAGHSGMQAANDFISIRTWSNIPAISVIAPHLTIIALTINDSNNAQSLVNYQAGIQSAITAAKASGDVVLATGCPSGTTQAVDGTLDQYIAVLRSLAVTNACPLIDFKQYFKSYATSNAFGLYDDTLHLTPAGYSSYAAKALASILSIGSP
jgi:lysophospholipase L1-like esterase